ncbi:hypothetical protein TWF102_002959 [Orbilia oligospora]|uniref:Rhodopsin domain-containing protein n=1 Tax=Orbilia oligospora TaxID=2813651 RepID=A0A7C8N2C3_ORBOL|nr:hypothetical protein TWF102_002959 [Orbilia oligospora]KAF3081222.1 hypothetical protein TWF706_002335 [Orbilia oligospora]
MSLNDIVDIDAVVVNSTGQTAHDLFQLRALWEILQVDGNPYITEGWLPPGLLDPEYVPHRQEGLKIGLTVAFLFGMLFTGLLVAFKIITTQRGRTTKLLFIEDWLLIIALLSSYAVLIVSFASMYLYQAGWHIWDVHIRSAEGTFRLIMVVNLLTIWTYTVTRISLLLSIRRLYSGFRTRMQLLCDVLVVCKLLYCFGAFAALIFQVPRHPGVLFDIWRSTIHKARPMNPTIGICAAGLALDCLILLTPLPLVPKLKKLKRIRQVQICIIFLCGFLTITASAARLWQIISLRHVIVSDQTYYVPLLELVNYFEVVLAIVTSCLPSAKFFFRWAYNKKAFPRQRRDSRPAETSRQGFFVDTQSSEIDTWNSRSDWQSLYAITSKADLEIVPSVQQVSRSQRAVSIRTNSFALLDEWEEDDDNFYDHLQPSEAFFPSATTGLSPRPRR